MAKARILIVDDDRPFAEFARMLLELAGYATTVCMQGERAVQIAATEKPDLILMDLGLMDMEGTEAIRRLKAEPSTQGIPIMVCSMSHSSSDVAEALKLGAVNFIPKPLKRDELELQISTALQNSGGKH